MWKFEGYIM